MIWMLLHPSLCNMRSDESKAGAVVLVRESSIAQVYLKCKEGRIRLYAEHSSSMSLVVALHSVTPPCSEKSWTKKSTYIRVVKSNKAAGQQRDVQTFSWPAWLTTNAL